MDNLNNCCFKILLVIKKDYFISLIDNKTDSVSFLMSNSNLLKKEEDSLLIIWNYLNVDFNKPSKLLDSWKDFASQLYDDEDPNFLILEEWDEGGPATFGAYFNNPWQATHLNKKITYLSNLGKDIKLESFI